jgi:hypothetical protein
MNQKILINFLYVSAVVILTVDLYLRANEQPRGSLFWIAVGVFAVGFFLQYNRKMAQIKDSEKKDSEK